MSQRILNTEALSQRLTSFLNSPPRHSPARLAVIYKLGEHLEHPGTYPLFQQRTQDSVGLPEVPPEEPPASLYTYLFPRPWKTHPMVDLIMQSADGASFHQGLLMLSASAIAPLAFPTRKSIVRWWTRNVDKALWVVAVILPFVMNHAASRLGMIAHAGWIDAALLAAIALYTGTRLKVLTLKRAVLLASVIGVLSLVLAQARQWLKTPVRSSRPNSSQTLVVTPPAAPQEKQPEATSTVQQTSPTPKHERPKLKRRPKNKKPPELPQPLEKLPEAKPPELEVPAASPQGKPMRKNPGLLTPLLQASEQQEAEILEMTHEADALKPADVPPLFTVAPSGSWEVHPDFSAVGITIGLPDVPLPHAHPLAEHKEEMEALVKERAAAEKSARDQAAVQARSQAVLDYAEVREREEAAEAPVEKAEAHADVLQKEYAMLAVLAVPSKGDLAEESPEELLEELSDDMKDFVGRAPGLEMVTAEESRERVHSLSNVHWYHRWFSFKSLSVNVMLNARGLSLWSLLSGGFNMQTYDKLDRGKEAETMRAAIASVKTLRDTVQKEILADLELVHADHGPRAALAAARVRLQFRGVSAAEISRAAAMNDSQIETFAGQQAAFYLDPLQARLDQLQTFVDALPPSPALGKIGVAVQPPSYGYVSGANRNNPAVPEIAPNKLTTGSGITVTIPQSDLHSPATTIAASASRAGHHSYLSELTIGPNLPARLAKKIVRHLHRKKHEPDPTKVPAMAGITAQLDPMVLLTGKPADVDVGAAFSVTSDPAVRQSAKEKAAKAQWDRDLASRVEQGKKETEAMSVPLLPIAGEAEISALAHAIATTPVPKGHTHVPYFTLWAGDATLRARFFAFTGNLKVRNIYRHPRRMKAAQKEFDEALKPLADRQQEIAERKLGYEIQGLIAVAHARWDAYVTARAANQKVEETRKRFVDAVVKVKTALAILPDDQQRALGLRWEEPPPPTAPNPEPTSVKGAGVIALPFFDLFGIVLVAFRRLRSGAGWVWNRNARYWRAVLEDFKQDYWISRIIRYAA